MKKEPHYFQREAIDAMLGKWREDKTRKPYVNLFTALGKSLTIADIMLRVVKKNRRVLCLVPRKELVEQNYEEAFHYFDPDQIGKLGICCNKLFKMQTNKSAIVAMYQSIASKKNLRMLGKIDVLLIDECHTVSSDEQSVIRKVIAYLFMVNPNMYVGGMTATHYRVGEGMLHEHSIYGAPFFTDLVYDSTVYPGIPRLIEEGYLAKIQTLSGATHIDTDGIPRAKADFNQAACGVKFHAIMPEAVADMRQKFDALGIETAIIFVSNVANGEDVLREWGDSSTMRMVTGNSSNHDRREAIHWLKHGAGRRILVNPEILTTGFNFPGLQSVVMLRATISLGLLIQIIGRLIRPFGDKVGVFIDYGTNCDRLLPNGLEKIEPPKPKTKKEEPVKKPCTFKLPSGVECGHWNHLNAKVCVKCGAYFNYSESEDGLYSMLSEVQVLQMERVNIREEYDVVGVLYEKTLSKKGDEMLVAKYFYDGGLQKKYLCFDTPGAAANMAKGWLKDVLVDYRHYIELQQSGTTTHDVYLLTQQAPEYFLTPQKIIVQDQKDSKKYKEIYKIVY